MPQETKQKFNGSLHAGSLGQGAVVQSADADELRRALDAALDYRGDITITLTSGAKVEGYLFDRRTASTLDQSCVRLIPTASTSESGEEKVTVRYSDIAMLAFSGKDTAAGKTWENWVRRYAEKKLKGESASIEAEKLD
jgi:hypothetical protein